MRAFQAAYRKDTDLTRITMRLMRKQSAENNMER